MKKFLFIVLACFVLANIGKAQAWQWAICESQTNGEGYSVAKDPANNAYMTSVLSGSAMIGTSVYTQTIAKTIVSKYDPLGNNIWNYVVYTNSGGYPAVACDNAGNAYVSAMYAGTITIGTYTFVTSGGSDFLLFKLDPSGNLMWATTGGGLSTELMMNISVDATGNAMICGYSSSALLFIGTNTLTISGTQLVVAKYDTNGNNLWAVTSTPSSGQISRANAISHDNVGSIYVAGNYNNNLVMGNQTLTSVGSQDIFILKLNANGNFMWMQSAGGISTDMCNDIQVDPGGDVYAVGAFTGTNAAIGGSLYTSTGLNDAWIAKFSPNGTYLWSRQIGSGSTEIGWSVAPYPGGVFFATSVLGPTIQIGATTYTSNSQDGMGFVQYDAAGNLLYATTIGGGGDDILDICQANGCTIYVAGDLFVSPVTVGTAVLTKTTTEALFLARFQMSTNMPTLSITGQSTICAGTTVTLNVTGASNYTWSTGALTNSLVFTPLTNTVVTVLGTGTQYVCTTTEAFSIQVNTAPNVSVAVVNPTICQGATTTLTASGATSYSWSSGPTTSVIIVSPQVNTTYTVVAAVPGGCSNSAQQLISVLAVPVLTLVPTSTLVCKNAKITYTVTGGNTYTWTNNSHAPTFSFIATTNTAVTVTATGFGNTCTVSATKQLSISACAGIDDVSTDAMQFSVFPNPAKNTITVLSQKTCILQLFNMLGKQIAVFEISADVPQNIDLTDYAAGMYFVHATDNGKIIKLIKSE